MSSDGSFRPSRRVLAVGALSFAALILVLVEVLTAGGGSTRHHTTSRATSGGGSPGGAQESPGQHRTIQVSAKAGSDGDGSVSRPFQQIQPALAMARPGDTVLVGPGDYRGPVHTVRAGTEDWPIRIVGHQAKISSDEHVHVVEINHDWIDFQGFAVEGGSIVLWVHGASHVRILHNQIHGARGECVRAKVQVHDDEIAFNHVYDCGRADFDVSAGHKNGEGIYIGTAPEQLDRNPGHQRDTSHDNHVHDNLIESRAECVDMKEGTHDNVISRNTCIGTEDPSGSGFDSRGVHNFIIGNLSKGNAGAGVRVGGDTPSDGIHNVIRGNQLIGNDGYAVKVLAMPQQQVCGNVLHGNDKSASNVDSVHPAQPCS